MKEWIIIADIALYVVGAIFTFWMHAMVVPNVTISLMLVRSAVWPIWIFTGWPHGVPLTMD